MTRARITAASIVTVLAVASTLTGIWDPDFFHHLAVGRAVAHGADFSRDPFVYTLADAPGSLPSYWLGSLLLYGANVLGGLPGPLLLVALLNVALCAVLLADALGDRSSWRDAAVAAALIILALPELRVRSAPRPEAFGVLLIAWTLLSIRRFELGRPRLLYLFPAVALVWSQLHVTVAIGLGLVGLLVAWRLALAVAGRLRWGWGENARFEEARTPALVLLAGTLAAAINPAQTSPIRLAGGFLASLLGLETPGGSGEIAAVVGVLRGVVEELHAPALSDWSRPFGVLLVVALASFALHRSRGWGRELATVAGFALLTVTSFRFAAMACVVAAPVAARNILGWLDSAAEARPRLCRMAAAFVVILGLARAATSPTLPLQPLSLALDSSLFPVKAAEYLRAIGFDGRVYNAFGAGGYLEWVLDRPVFQDGRGLARAEDMRDLFPEPVDRARLANLDARWSFDALVISTEPPVGIDAATAARIAAIRTAAADPRAWSLVAMDDGGALYLRRTGRWAALATRDEYRLLEPGGSVRVEWLFNPETVRAATLEFQRLVRDSPGCLQCRVSLAGLLLEAGRTPEAGPHLDALDRAAVPRFRRTVELLKAMRSAQSNR